MNASLHHPIVALGDLVEIRSSLVNPLLPEMSRLPHVGPEHIVSGSGVISWGDVKSCAEDGVTSGKYEFQPGDLIYSKIRPYLNKAAIADRGGLCSADMYAITISSTVCREFIHHYLQSRDFLSYASSFSGRANIPKLNRQQLLSSPMPLPPLDEQKRIAAILDKADQLRRKRRQTIALLDSLTQAIFLEMFGNANEVPLIPIGEFCTVKGGKRLPKGHDYIDDDEGHYYLRVSDFQKSDLIKKSLKRISRATHQKIRRYTVSSGELAISIAGTIGETLLISEALDGVNLTENAAKISISDNQTADPLYLKTAISMPHAQNQIASSTGQVTIGKLALFRIEKIEIPLPRIDKQVAFANVVREIERGKRNFMVSADFSEALFSSLQHRAFSGQL